MRIESNDACGIGALDDERVDAVLFDLRATLGPKRGIMRRDGANDI